MTYRESEKAVKLFAAIVVGTALLIILLTTGNANAQVRKSTDLQYHQKLQKEMSWENHKANRLKKAKQYAKENRKQSKAIKREEAINARIRKYYAKSK